MYISVDVGGTNTRVASTAELTDPVFLAEPLRRKNSHNFDNDLSFIVDAALTLSDGQLIEAIGIGTPGPTNKHKTEITHPTKNLASWVGKPLVASLSESLDCRVFLDSDTTAGGLGEAYYGNIGNDFDFITWGTGIGGGAVTKENSRPKVLTHNWQTYFCDWENDVGGSELMKRFGKAPEDFTSADWKVIMNDFKKHLSTYIELQRPRAIVFGGGLAVKHAASIEALGHSLGPVVSVSKFGHDSGLIGGFGLIRNHLTS